MTHRGRRILRLILGTFLPHTAVVAAKAVAVRLQGAGPVHALPARPGARAEPPPFSYEEAVAVLTSRGLDEDMVRLGSVSEASMKFAREVIARHAPARPLRGLHVGNYVGLSLAALTDIVVRHDPASVVVSIDPNASHLGIDDPQREVLTLLGHFGLQANNLVVCGYSLSRSLADPACEDGLINLERLGHRFDVALIDGNHDAEHLRSELDVLVRLLNVAGLLILDDVSHAYEGIRRLFKEVAREDAWPLEKVASDERLGVLRKTAA